MTNIAKYVVELSGWSGGPGVNVWYFSAGTLLDMNDIAVQNAYDAIHATYAGLVGAMRPGVTVKVDQNPSIIDVATGQLVNVLPVATPAADLVTSTGTGTESVAVQALLRLTTSNFIGGRRLQGRHFIGPMQHESIDSSGNIAAGVATALGGAYSGAFDSPGTKLCVYHRPTSVAAADGQYGDVVTVTCASKPGILRSRRD